MVALAIPGGMQDVFHPKEMHAIREIQIIAACQTIYLSQFGKYATSLAELGATNLIPSSLASGRKDGYLFSVEATQSGYIIHAELVVFGKTQPATADSPGVAP